MKKVFQLAALALVVAGCGCGMSPQDRLTVNDKKINEIIAQMTLEEKVEMLHSKTNMSSEGVPRLRFFIVAVVSGIYVFLPVEQILCRKWKCG